MEHRPQVIRSGVAVGGPIKQKEDVLRIFRVGLRFFPLLVEQNRFNFHVYAQFGKSVFEQRGKPFLGRIFSGIRQAQIKAAVWIAGFRQQFSGLVHILRVLHHVFGVRPDAGRNGSPRLGGLTKRRHVNDVLVRHGIRQRLAHFCVVQRRP